jgi:hypothetical protein
MRYLLAFAALFASCTTDAPIAEVCPYPSPSVCTLEGVCSTPVALCGCRVPHEIKVCLTCKPWGSAPFVPQAGGSCFDWVD